MPNPLPLPPNPLPLPLREALRRLRYVARRSGRAAREIAVSAHANLGEGSVANRIAATVLEEMGQLAARVDDVASRAAHVALGQPGELTATLPEIYDSAQGGPPLAAALYTALTLALKHIGADGSFVSELAANDATQSWRAARLEGGASLLAAHLALLLAELQVIRGSAFREGGAPAQVAIFGVMLWLLVARGPEESEVALMSATDIAAALADRVAAAFAGHDTGALVALFEKYRNNV